MSGVTGYGVPDGFRDSFSKLRGYEDGQFGDDPCGM
jgi:hypothetical protein